MTAIQQVLLGAAGAAVPGAPVNTAVPAISGATIVGSTLTTTNGTWTGSPTGYTYQWQRGGVNISGATASTYLLASADNGTTTTVTVTATNTAGSASATSAGVGPITAPATTTWNPSDKSPNVNLSGGNLIAVGTGQGSVRTVASKTAGKYYWEISTDVISGTETGVGCSTSAYSLTGNTIGSGSNGAGTSGANRSGTVVVEGSVKSTIGGFGVGVAVCIALDLDNKLIWYRLGAAGNWNASGTANPATATGGYSFTGMGGANPVFPVGSVGAFGDQLTANFGGSAFSGAVPSGFTAGWPPTPTTWSTTDVSAGMTLSNGNLTAFRPASTGNQFARSSTAKTTGKVYCEIVWGAKQGGGGHDGIGLATSSTTVSPWINNGTGGLIIWSNQPYAYFNGNTSTATFGTSCGPGDVACFAIDLVNSRIWLRRNGGNWNNSGTANPATNVGGTDISALFPTNPVYMYFASDGTWDDSGCTINFGATTFAQAVPSGFAAWG